MLYFNRFKFELCSRVAEPNFSSYYLSNHLNLFKGENALDLGTGCGFFAIVLSEGFDEIYAIDIVNEAIECTNLNSKLNEVDSKVHALKGNLFDPVRGMKFDLIVSNPPQMPTPSVKEREDWIGFMDNGGVDGREIVDEIIENASNFLKASGKLVIVHLDVANIKKTILKLQDKGLRTKILAEHKVLIGRLEFERKEHIEKFGISFIAENKHLFQKVAIIEGEKS